MEKIIKRFWWIPAIVVGIIAIFAFSIIGTRPAFLGTWVYPNGTILTIDKNTWTESDKNEKKPIHYDANTEMVTKKAYTYDANTEMVTLIDDGSTEHFKVDTSTKDELRLNDFDAAETTTLYRKGSKLANGAIAASSARSKVAAKEQAQTLKEEKVVDAKLIKKFKVDKRHVVKIESDFYYTTWTSRQIVAEAKKLNARLDDDINQASEEEITTTFGTNITFADDYSLREFLSNGSDDYVEWYENALAAKEAGVITTENELDEIVK